MPADMKLITLIIMGEHSDKISQELSEKQAKAEMNRPGGMPINELIRIVKLPV